MVSKFHTRTNIIQNRNSHFLNFVWGGGGQFHFIIFINENKPLTITIIDFFLLKLLNCSHQYVFNKIIGM